MREEYIRTLALLEPGDAPLISFYLDRTSGPAGYQKVVEERLRIRTRPELRHRAGITAARRRPDLFTNRSAFQQESCQLAGMPI